MPNYFKLARDPISSYSHFIGAIGSAAATVLLIIKTLVSSPFSAVKFVSCLIFGLSLTMLYSASYIYHYVKVSPKVILALRKLDHSMIYVLIAGTYTPLLLSILTPVKAAVFTSAIWFIAFSGIIMKICWINAPRWLGTALYIAMGWAILADVTALAAMPAGAVIYLVLGGVAYTAGGIIYGLKKPNISKIFGFHELFHIFVLLGSLLHFIMVYFYLA